MKRYSGLIVCLTIKKPTYIETVKRISNVTTYYLYLLGGIMNFQCIEYSIEPESTHLYLDSQHNIEYHILALY